MHGAIAADTLRVPWIPYRCSTNIGTFKWQDWCASMDLKYEPLVLHPYLEEPQRHRLFRHRLSKVGLGSLAPVASKLLRGRYERMREENLESLRTAASGRTWISTDSTFDARHARMRERLEFFREKYPSRNYG
jgi:succinoglycan biosynthesis protein ExoV